MDKDWISYNLKPMLPFREMAKAWVVNHVKILKCKLPMSFNPLKAFKSINYIIQWLYSPSAIYCIILILSVLGLINTFSPTCHACKLNHSGVHKLDFDCKDLVWKCNNVALNDYTLFSDNQTDILVDSFYTKLNLD